MRINQLGPKLWDNRPNRTLTLTLTQREAMAVPAALLGTCMESYLGLILPMDNQRHLQMGAQSQEFDMWGK